MGSWKWERHALEGLETAALSMLANAKQVSEFRLRISPGLLFKLRRVSDRP